MAFSCTSIPCLLNNKQAGNATRASRRARYSAKPCNVHERLPEVGGGDES